MRRDEALAMLADELDALRAAHGVASLTLFGSVARDEARPDSDVDLLVEFQQPVGAFAFLALKERLEQVLGRRVALVTPRALEAPAARAHRAGGHPCRPATGGSALKTS